MNRVKSKGVSLSPLLSLLFVEALNFFNEEASDILAQFLRCFDYFTTP